MKRVFGFIKKYAPKGYFFKLFSLISIILAIFIIIMAFVLFGRFNEHSENSLQTANENILKQISYNVQFTNDYVNQLLLLLYKRQETDRLLYATENNIVDTIHNIMDLDETLAPVPFIDSVYLYNGTLETFYIMGSKRYIRKQNEFQDQQVLDWIQHPDQIQGTKPVYRQIETMENEGNKGVFTYILYDEISITNKIPRLIVINIKADWMMNNLKNMSENQFGPNGIVYIVDSAGHIVEANTQQTPHRLDLFQNSCIDLNRLQSESLEGHYSCEVEHNDYLATYQSIPGMNWQVLVLSTNQFFNTEIRDLRKVIIVISGLLIIIGMLLTIFIAKWLHLPILSLKRNVSFLFDDLFGKNNDKNEFKYVDQTFKKVKEDLTKLQLFKNKHLLTLRYDILKKLLFQQVYHDQLFQQLNIKLAVDGQYNVVLFKVDQWLSFKKTFSNDQWESMQSDMNVIISNYLSRYFNCEVIHWEDQWVAIIETSAKLADISQNTTLMKHLIIIQQQLADYLHGSLSLMVSPKGVHLDSIPYLYKGTEYLAQYRLHFGSGCILSDDSIYEIIEDNMVFPVQMVNQLKDKLVYGDIEGTQWILTEIISYFSAYSIQNVKFGIIYLLHQIYETINNIESNSEITFDFDLIQLNQSINEMETLDDVEQLIQRVLTSTIQRINERKEDKSTIRVEQMKDYIAEHLTDFNLSPTQIASHMHMSIDYVRKLFKKEMTISIAAYINQERINVLAEQLITSEQTIDTLLDNMGWDNKNYFFKLFKTQFGVTPTEYRLTRTKLSS